MLRFARLAPLALPLVFSACNCDEVLGQLPAPLAVLAHGADETPPLDIVQVGLDPTPLATTATVDLDLRNDGNADLVVSDVVFGSDPDLCPAPSGAFTIEDPQGPAPRTFTLKKTTRRTLTVGFTPTSGAPGCTVVEVHSNDPASPVLRAVITGQGDAPQLCTDRGIIDFGEVFVGDHKDDTVHLTSCGTRPITITGATLNEQFPDPFTAAAVATGAPLAPGDAIDIPVTFAPLVEGTWSINNGTSGTISLTTDAPQAADYRVDLVGTARRPPSCEIQVVPDVVQFGNIGQDRTSTQSVFVRNIGELACTFTSADIREPAGSFTRNLVSLAGGDVLQPQQSGQVDVTFAPTAVNGVENGFLDVVTDDPVNPAIAVPLEGTSVEVTPCFLEAQPTALNFGVQPILHSVERTVTLTNVGTDSCILKHAQLAAGAPDFTVLEPALPITPVPSGSSVGVVATFRPQSAGSKTGTARITYKLFGFGNPDQTLDVPLSGQAQAPCISVTPQDIDYGTVAAGATADRDVTVRNCGGVDLSIRGVSLRTGSDPGFAVSAAPAVPTVIAAGAAETVTVRAAPQAAGAMFGTLEVLSDVDPQLVSLRANAPDGCNNGLVCRPDHVAFGEVEVDGSLVKSIICVNPSNTTVTLSPSGISDPFTVVSAPASVPPNGQAVIRVKYAPTAAGDDSATLSLGANTCSGAPLTAGLRGTGVDDDLPPCPTASTFDPQEVWNWDGGTTAPSSNQVWTTALVSRLEDTDGDGAVTRADMPRVIFLSFDKADSHLLSGVGIGGSDQINDPIPGLLRAVDGATGAEVWTAGNDDPEHRLNSSVTPALADIDGDGCVDIIGEKYVLLPGVEEIPNGPKVLGKFARGNLIAFDCHGAFKWISDEWTRSANELEDDGGIAVGDVDGDGFAEIAVADHLYDHNGHLLWRGGRGIGSAGHGPVSVLADVDGQPGLELVAGPTVYRADGSILWDHLDDVGYDGLPAVADLDGDGINEVVFRSGEVDVFEGPTGQRLAGPRYPATRSSMSGPDCDFQAGNDPSAGDDTDPCNIIPANPALMDIDHDGHLDIAVPAQQQLDCYDMNLNEMWRGTIYDGTGASGPMGFDFEADGYQNVVFADESHLFGWNSTGGVVYQAARQSVTMYEYPSLADINNDGHANFLIGSNDPFIGVAHGLKAYANTGTGWAQARGIWNQHPYIEDLISELGTPIPNTTGAMPYRAGFRTATPQCVP